MNENMRILIAYDGSDCSDAALSDLRRAGLPQRAEAVVLSVAEVPLTPGPTALEGEYALVTAGAARTAAVLALAPVDEAHELALRARKRILANFPAWEVSAEACIGLPDRTIIQRAMEWRPDLVVVGSHGRSTLGRFVLGSVSLKVLSRAIGSVRVARGSRRHQDAPVRILVGVDGSPGSDEAVRLIASRAWPLGSEVRVTAVLDPRVLTTAYPLVPEVPPIGPEDRNGQDWVQRITAACVARLEAPGLSAAAFIREGDPKHVLIDEAIRWGADCIFVGARGLGRLERFLIGSVSTSVAARAHCSVEVVRPLRFATETLTATKEPSYDRRANYDQPRGQ